uniref:Uncharacterized protein n=1 Tax=Anguilla anguilla TaxID=7936 RepID=A0A0E9VM29_ANGAN
MSVYVCDCVSAPLCLCERLWEGSSEWLLCR